MRQFLIPRFIYTCITIDSQLVSFDGQCWWLVAAAAAAGQRVNTLSHVARSDQPIEEAVEFSAELSESSLEFIKKQSNFVHDIVRYRN